MSDKLKTLTRLQYQVTQNCATEPPFQNEFWNHHEQGIYVDIISGSPLFASIHKFDSGTGWPSFSQAIEAENIVQTIDKSHNMQRIEVRSKHSNSHLGHLFYDAPEEGGLRYCINSASLKFIPKDQLTKLGYDTCLGLFGLEKAILAGGCFWGMEELIRHLPGVTSTRVGYIGGNISDPKYPQVKTGKTGHAESIEILYDHNQLSYRKLLEFFFQIHDPSTLNQQGNDIGTQYRSAIFYINEQQKQLAQQIIEEINHSGKWPGKVLTEVSPATMFYEAESEHQAYLANYPQGYTCHFIRKNWRLNQE